MRLMGQRWIYRVGATTIHVDNAFDAWGRGNERMVVDGVVHGQATSWMKRSTVIAAPVIVDGIERRFEATVRGGVVRMFCEATLDGAPIEPAGILETDWKGAIDSWPDENAWKAEGWIAKRP
ncbi:hypothetical protein ACETK8_08675 [Brevundimonas staleyi]|uniref:Uncharacterized protein n=1 Tax=Brevundimonas staleyi TaxID=74326 RepID=A0ABW0FMX0_9CAUL